MKKTALDHASLAGVTGYLLLLIVLPVGAIFQQAFQNGWGTFIKSITNPIALASLRLTIETSLLTACINTVMGTVIAYALVRLSLPGKAFLNSIIDFPFAIPTTVSGLMLIFLYGPHSPVGGWLAQHGIKLIYSTAGIVMALVFITFPFTIRAVQPLLEEMDPGMEEAAMTLGATGEQIIRKIMIPSVLPGILTGFTLTFSRSLAEFGSVVMISGNLPMKTLVAPVYLYGQLENYNTQAAAAMSVVLLMISFLGLFYQSYVLRRAPKAWWQRYFISVKKRFERRAVHEASDWSI